MEKKKFKLDRINSNKITGIGKTSIRFIAFLMASTMLLPISGCGKTKSKQDNNNNKDLYGPFVSEMVTDDDSNLTSDVTSEYAEYKSIVENNVKELKKLFPSVSDEIIKDSSLIILLNILAPKDLNGKINTDIISNFKSRIDTDNMMWNLNSLFDTMEKMAFEGNIISISSVLPESMNDEKKILSYIEKITYNIKTLSSDANNEDKIKKEFSKIYALFVDGKEIEIDGFKFKVSDLSYGLRAAAHAYARISINFAREKVSKENIEKVDKSTNDQNNKAYIKTILEILRNGIDEVSKENIIKILENKYTQVKKLLQNKINADDNVVENLVNFMNIEYITSDKVSTKDKNYILRNYDENIINEVTTLIGAIVIHNLRSETGYIAFSDFLIDPYLKTDKGSMSYYALNDIELYAILSLKGVNENKDKDIKITDISYFNNIKSYLTRDNFIHKYEDETGNVVSKDVISQSIGIGSVFINDITVKTLFDSEPFKNVKGMESFIKKADENMIGSINDMAMIITGECNPNVFKLVK